MTYYNKEWRKIVMDCQCKVINKETARKKIEDLKKTKPQQPTRKLYENHH